MGADIPVLTRLGRDLAVCVLLAGHAPRVAALQDWRSQPEAVQAPRVALYAVAPEFALQDVIGRRRRSEHLFANASVLVFTDATRSRESSRIVALLTNLRERFPCDAFAVVVVDMAPRWADAERLTEVYRPIERAVILRDPDRELGPIYLLDNPPLVFLLDQRTEVRFWGKPQALEDMAGGGDLTALLKSDVCS